MTSLEPVARQDTYLRLLASAVRRHLVLVIAVTLLAVAAAGAYAHHKPPKYTATSTVLPRPAIGNPLSPSIIAASGTQLTVAMETEAGLVDTPAVAALASKSLGRTVPGPRDTVVATVPPNTQIIKITYVGGTAKEAQEGAQAFADAFLQYRSDVASTSKQETLAGLRKQQVATAAAFQRATQEAAASQDPHSLAAQQVHLYTDRLASLSDSVSTTQSLSTDPGVVVTAAELPKGPDGINPKILVVAGGLLGLAIALLIAVRLEWRADVVDTATEFDVGGVPLLAVVPDEAAAAVPEQPVSGPAPDGPVQEAYRRMRAGLIAVAEPAKVVAISCVSPDERSGQVVSHLGVALAQSGFRVTVVGADPF